MGFSLLLHSPESRSLTYWRLPAAFCSLAHFAALVLRWGGAGAVLLLLER